MGCVRPPLESPPEGDWFCPECVGAGPPINDQFYSTTPEVFTTASPQIPHHDTVPFQPSETPQALSPPPREASTSSPRTQYDRSKRKRPRPTPRRKSKAAPVASEESEEVDADAVIPAPVQRSTRKGKERARVAYNEETPVSSPAQSRRRAHVVAKASHGSEKTLPRVRLRLGKQKGPEEDDPLLKGLFDDILSEQDRDVSSTSIYASDKVRFDRSLRNAEV
jgi:hypothetical protein